MTKTYTSGSITNTVELRTFGNHSAIVILEQNGNSLRNEWGGYPTLNAGDTDYVTKIFNKL